MSPLALQSYHENHSLQRDKEGTSRKQENNTGRSWLWASLSEQQNK